MIIPSASPGGIRELGLEAGGQLPRRVLRAAAMAVLALVAGVGLLALAGWFIASSAVAGLAAASTFSFLYPSATVQALAVARTLSRYGERISTHEVTLDLVGRLRTTLFGRALALPRNRASELRSSDLLGRITADTDAVENLLLRTAFPLILAFAALVGGAAFLAVFSVPVALAVAIGVSVTSCVLITFGHRQSRRPAQALVAARTRARVSLIEAIDGLPELRSFGAQPLAKAEVARNLVDLAASRRRLSALAARGQSVGGVLADLTLFAVVAVAAGLVLGPRLSPPIFVMACLIAIVIFEPVSALPGAVSALARGRAAAVRLSELFPASPLSVPPTTKRSLPVSLGSVSIELEERSVGGIIVPGDGVLLSGPSGSGKSTLLRAIAGERVEDIRVQLGGSPTDSFDPSELTTLITLVAQDAQVFDTTIRENLLLASPAAAEDELWAALSAAALDDAVAQFPQGLDTPVGPSGSALSGGQRRRLTVAQGLLRRPEVLLLDEPTEGLDLTTAIRLLTGVREFLPATILFVALHDRQRLYLPWKPKTTIELYRSVSGARAALPPRSQP
jgi:ATP-binding cassette subfamily C protein CydC